MATIDIVWKRRRAVYTPQTSMPSLNLTKGTPVECRVWGCYQVSDSDGANPYFIIELADGHCTYASPECIQFIKEEDEC